MTSDGDDDGSAYSAVDDTFSVDSVAVVSIYGHSSVIYVVLLIPLTTFSLCLCTMAQTWVTLPCMVCSWLRPLNRLAVFRNWRPNSLLPVLCRWTMRLLLVKLWSLRGEALVVTSFLMLCCGV